MSLLKNIAKLVRRAPFEFLVGAAIILLATVLFAEHRYMSDTFDSSRSWSSASAELKVRVTESHLWLEERLGGDRSIDVRRQVFGNIDAARAQCRALVNGGRTDVGEIERLPAGEAQSAAASTCAEIQSLRTAAIARLSAGANDVGQPADQAYDAAFSRVRRLSRETERAAEMHVEDRHTLMDRTNTATIAFLFLLLAAIVALIRRHQARLRRLSERRDSILNSAGEGIYGLDREGRVVFVNAAAARLTGHELDELIGRRSHDMVHHTRPDGSPYPIEECPGAAAVSEGRAERVSDDLYWRKDGTSFPVEYTSTPIVEDGEVTGAVVVFKDISERRRTEELLERQRRQLVEAQAVGGFGSWEWDIAADTIDWSDELCRIYGLEPGSHPASFEEVLELAHPDDRALMQAVVQGAFESGEPFSFELRIIRADGAVRTTQSRGEVVTGGDGTPLRMLGTAQDISERRAAERAKDEFTSVVSHELRTPLTSIRGSLGLLESGVLGPLPEQGQRMVEIAVENTDRLVRLISDILDIERIDSGKIDMQPAHCDAAELVERAIQSVEGVAAEARVRLIADARPAALEADPDRVLQTLTNLISNAVKFSEAGAPVRVCCERREGEVLFQVADEGRGIPADKLETIFERFQQVDASDSREKGGTGLGLAICRTIVEHHGGRIWAESELGAGATFAFALPAGTSEGSPPADRDGDGPAILVCDDDAAVVEVVGAVLEQRGYRVIPAHSGEQALERALAERPDAILLDLLMPGMSGWEVAAELKQHPRTSDIPIVILSVLSQGEGDAPRAEVADWIEKPLDEQALFRALERAVSARSEPFKVLVVEDDEDLAAILTATFERHGIETFRAADGRAAIELSQQVSPDLLVLDIGLPEADGFEVVDWLRRHERLRALPIVVYTARELDEADRERLRLGASTEFLTKGRITPQDFEQHVLRLLGRLTRDRTEEASDEREAHFGESALGAS